MNKEICQRITHLSSKVETLELIKSYSARYFLVSNCYSVLKKWKTNHGPAFDRIILRMDDDFARKLKSLKNRADFIVPIPQDFKRSFKLRGSPAEKIALCVSDHLNIPVIKALHPHSNNQGKRQAELGFYNRFFGKPVFQLKDLNLAGKNALLVDDFMTTGQTLRAAAETLTKAGVKTIHAFCLGVRPKLSEKREPTCIAAVLGP